MTYFKRKILSILEPSIKLKRITRIETDTDIDANKETLEPNSTRARKSVQEGGTYPLIFLKDHAVSFNYLLSFSLDLYNRIPEINFSFEDVDGSFDVEIPIDGDDICLYLRPADTDNLKPIRIDFDIVNVSPTRRENKPSFYAIKGIMKIPGFFNDICKGFKSNTSFEHIQDACESVGLGFASNEEFTDDQMTRICAFNSLRKFVDDTVTTSYKDDKSFFNWFIDPYYYLCFVNVNKQLSVEIEPDDININKAFPTDSLYLEKDSDLPEKGKLVLTNNAKFGNSNIFISNYSISGEHGRWLTEGYIKKPIIFDVDTKEGKSEKITYQIESMITDKSETSFVKQKGQPHNNFYKSQTRYHWVGKQEATSIGGNVHDSFIFSEFHNYQNNIELNKINLELELTGINLYIQKYTMIPVEIYHMIERDGNWKEKRFKERNDNLGTEDNIKTSKDATNESGEFANKYDGYTQYINKFLSGFYLITGIRYSFVKGGIMKTYLTLTRREHNIPAKNNDLIQ